MMSLNKTLIQPEDTLVVAVSGGIDSMVLLAMLNAIKQEYRLKMVVAHVNHHTRPDTIKEAELVKKTAENYQIPCEIFDYTHTGNDNFQQAARLARMDFFTRVAKHYNADKLVLAHQADDQAETVLMRLVRGSSLSTISGMRPTTTLSGLTVIRPLLEVSRKQIEEYQKEHQIAYLEDGSNHQDHYTRNRFRHQILPLCLKENPLFLEKITQFSVLLQDATHYIRTEAKKIHDLVVTYEGEGASVAIDRLKSLNPVILRELLILVVNTMSRDTIEISHRQLQDLIALIHDPKPQLEIDIDQSLIAIKRYHTVDFVREKPLYPHFEHQLLGFGSVALPQGATFSVLENISNSRGNQLELWYNDLDSIFPLLVRNRRLGDRIVFPYGSKKLKTFFIEKKVPQSERETLPLVFSKTGDLLWIPGYYRKRSNPGGKSLILDYWKGKDHVGERH